ncbi:oligopeptide transport system ATP-binding protein [Tistlia consotensis]|uniref:Oligopeptide transport system ATP-binding protein n=1 Tax=Tistlia consotensis USBA 355 TaxID=560819 RepID=A0A1Y6C517_9PROT|nr:ABC transporter ATP-binding protein [Tistlia consotensis]SMF36525.1 oligopeptide transport system ATP-binding protein [Tistlia consotensis USBA 355]SNR72055.1 oligopeptide transport system ATP-binding protein [Tistlia consotensis]
MTPTLHEDLQLQVRDLEIAVVSGAERKPVVKGISFDIRRNETVCLVGESGCGKSVTALAVMGLLQTPPMRIVGGEILLRAGEEVFDLARLDPRGRAFRRLRGAAVSMIFQEPMTSLNPVHRNGAQIVEVIRRHTGLGRRAAWQRMLEMLRLVGIPSPEVRARQYPHELSGGMRQRVMIALALACRPGLLLADEPTTALDVTTQAQILTQIRELSRSSRTSTLFITHDLGVVAQIADRVHVMYLGEVVESGPVREIFHRPRHPYTRGLLASVPSIESEPFSRLTPIRGTVADLPENPAACPFEPRCESGFGLCRGRTPPLFEVSTSHRSKCWLEQEGRP